MILSVTSVLFVAQTNVLTMETNLPLECMPVSFKIDAGWRSYNIILVLVFGAQNQKQIYGVWIKQYFLL